MTSTELLANNYQLLTLLVGIFILAAALGVISGLRLLISKREAGES